METASVTGEPAGGTIRRGGARPGGSGERRATPYPCVGVDGGAEALLPEQGVALLLEQVRLPLRLRPAARRRRRHPRRPALASRSWEVGCGGGEEARFARVGSWRAPGSFPSFFRWGVVEWTGKNNRKRPEREGGEGHTGWVGGGRGEDWVILR
jgi:hypothetical protein